MAGLIEAWVLAAALSVDAFVASFAYGSSRIRIPLLSVLIMDVIGAGTLTLSLAMGNWVQGFLPEWMTSRICFLVLLVLGLIKLLDGVVKSLIRRFGRRSAKLNFSLCSLRFVLTVYADPETADLDQSNVISPGEAASLALALSLDGLAVGFGAAMGDVNDLAAVGATLVINALAILAGAWLGNRAAGKLPFPVSWLGGVILIVIAVLKLC